jgi:hypothetical protein
MIKQFMTLSAWLVGGYLVLSYATGAGTLINNGAAGIVSIDKALQGR